MLVTRCSAGNLLLAHRTTPANQLKRHVISRIMFKGVKYRPFIGIVASLADDQHRSQRVVRQIHAEIDALEQIGSQRGDVIFYSLVNISFQELVKRLAEARVLGGGKI